MTLVRLAVALGLIASAGCAAFDRGSETSRPGRVVVVLFDLSGSTGTDRPIYEAALLRVVGSLQAGDRFVMGPITSRSGADFVSSVNVVLPTPPVPSLMEAPSATRRNLRTFQEEFEAKRLALGDAVQSFLDQKASAQQTAIFESLRTIAPVFHAEQRQRILVLLSDMIEESPLANFERVRLTDELIEKEIERHRTMQILPDLSDVLVYVAGAVSSPPERSAAIERFWFRYFRETNARLEPGQYGRVLLNFVD